MDVAFTGTRKGMSQSQFETVKLLLRELWAAGAVAHLGDAIGADEQARQIASDVGYRTHGHPSNIPSQRAYGEFAVLANPRPPLRRNHAMVDSADVVIACPAGYDEEARSGTWATMRYARAIGIPLLIVWPNGGITKHYRAAGELP